MELSSDNIEELAKALSSDHTSSHKNDVFQMKPDLSSLDVDRVISDTQDSLLKTSMEAIRSSDVPCSFNDILDDICKMNNNIELQQAAVGNNLPIETQLNYHMPDLEMQPHDYTTECSFSNQTDFLPPLGGQWSEFLPLPPAALSTIQDIPQLAPIPIATKPASPIPDPVTVVPQENNPTTTPPNSIDQEEKQFDSSSISISMAPPLQFINNFQYTIQPEMQQIEMPSTNIQFAQCPDGNINFMVFPEQPMMQTAMPIVQQQGPYFDWARVVRRPAFIQPPEIVVLRPLRTRKVASSRPAFDLASYFDTSNISIPMIRERPRPRAHRRKQKLYTIPGADNLVFEVQLEPEIDDNNNNDDQLYPENEIPELDEIFKRKRRTLNPKRNPPQNHIKKSTEPPSNEIPIETKEEEFVPSPSEGLHAQDDLYSDIESDDEPFIKSMKCRNCRKLFKTHRSMTIHLKRCKVIRQPSPKVEDDMANVTTPEKPTKPAFRLLGSEEETTSKNKFEIGRPLTRSQTRKALKRKQTLDPEDDEVGAQKLSK